MFSPSDKTLNYLSNALTALGSPPLGVPRWFELLAKYGLASYAHVVDTLGDPTLETMEFSSESLQGYLQAAKKDNPEQLRNLCSELLRREEEYRSESPDATAFSDNLAQFKVQLEKDGFKFDAFEIVDTSPRPSITKLGNDAFESLLHSQKNAPQGQKVIDHLVNAEEFLLAEKYEEAMTNLRLALKYQLEGIATELSKCATKPLSSQKEQEVRNFLREVSFLTEEEYRGFSGIYGLLSAGPHGKAARNTALLGYVACVMACQYAIEKFQSWKP